MRLFFAGGITGLVEAEVIAEVHKPGARCGAVPMVVVKLGTVFRGVGHSRVRGGEIRLGWIRRK